MSVNIYSSCDIQKFISCAICTLDKKCDLPGFLPFADEALEILKSAQTEDLPETLSVPVIVADGYQFPQPVDPAPTADVLDMILISQNSTGNSYVNLDDWAVADEVKARVYALLLVQKFLIASTNSCDGNFTQVKGMLVGLLKYYQAAGSESPYSDARCAYNKFSCIYFPAGAALHSANDILFSNTDFILAEGKLLTFSHKKSYKKYSAKSYKPSKCSIRPGIYWPENCDKVVAVRYSCNDPSLVAAAIC